MFEKILANMQKNIDKEQRIILLEYIQKVMHSGFVFVEEKIAKDVTYICKNGTNDELMDLYILLTDLSIECHSHLITLDNEVGGEIEEYFTEYVKTKNLKSAKSKIHTDLDKLISEVSETKKAI